METVYEHEGFLEAAVPSGLKRVCVRTASANLANQNPIPHCKQLGVKLATLPSSGGGESSRQLPNVQSNLWVDLSMPLGLLCAGINFW